LGSDTPEFPTDQDILDFLIQGQDVRQEIGVNPDGLFGDSGAILALSAVKVAAIAGFEVLDEIVWDGR